MQIDFFPTRLDLRKSEPALNRRRFYRLRVEQSLFGEWCLIREWGRVGSPGTSRTDWHFSSRDALNALNDQGRAKVRLGYHPV